MAFLMHVEVAVRDGVPISYNDRASMPISEIWHSDRVTLYSGITWSEEQAFGIWRMYLALYPDLYITMKFWPIDNID